MTAFRLLLGDRKRRQRGSVLSGLLIIVAFLSILVGALMTELTSSFLISRTLVARTQHEATVASAIELAINGLQNSVPPRVCAQDDRGPWFVTLNGSPAAVTQTCTAIVPDVATGLASGAYVVDGVQDTAAGENRYLVAGSSGQLAAYPIGHDKPSWTIGIGGTPTATLLSKTDSDGSLALLIPVAMAGSGCGGHCVAAFDDAGAAPTFRCSMPASTTVTSAPAAELNGAPHFPDYAFFAGSGASGTLYVYDDSTGEACSQEASAALGGGAAGAPLVFPGTVRTKNGVTTTNDELFVLVSDGADTSLDHWRYSEVGSTASLNQVGSLDLTSALGGTAVGYAFDSSTLTLAIAGTSGKLARVRIAVGPGPTYTPSIGARGSVPGAVSRPPYWCQCPDGDLIGVGSTNGSLYLLNTSLAIQWSYDGQADGRPAINTTPAADENGDWYFGADDGFVYDVEIPVSGSQLFKAARFGPGGAIRSSPIVGGDVECGDGPCIYFGSATAGTYFAQLGDTRVIDLRACLSDVPSSTDCAANPRLWARVEVGLPGIVGGSGVYVQGWSYYSP